MISASLSGLRQLLNRDMDSRSRSHRLLFQLEALTTMATNEDFLIHSQTLVHYYLLLIHELATKAAKENDLALGELANNEYLYNELPDR